MTRTSSDDGRERAAARFAWLNVVLAVWIIGGLFLVVRALNLGLTTDVGISPYHAVAYLGLAALLLVSLVLVARAVARRRPWRQAFPSGYGTLGAGLIAAVLYVVLDPPWRELVGIGLGIEGGFAPTRLLLVVAVALIAVGPLRVAIRDGGAAGSPWPAAISAALLLAVLSNPGGFHPAVNPWMEKPVDVRADDGEIWVMNADGSGQVRLIEAPGGEVHASTPAWSPDGSRIAWTRWQPGADDELDADVWVALADGSDAHTLAAGQGWQWLPHWSPDGQWVGYTDEPAPAARSGAVPVGPRPGGPIAPDDPAFEAGPAPLVANAANADLWRIPADGGGSPERITEMPGDDRAGVYSPDGTRIAFDASRDGNTEIYVMSADGSDQRRITEDGGEDWAPAWSPDGARIVFNSDRGGTDDLYLVGADGSGLTQLTSDAAYERGASWGPDGSWIAFATWNPDDTEIWSIAPGGGEWRNLTRSPSTIDGDWDAGDIGPDGRIVFTRSSYLPAFADPLAREDLGMASLLLQAALVSFVALLLLLAGPPFGAFALLLGLSTALIASGADQWRFIPAAILGGLVIDLLVRRLPRDMRAAAAGAGSATAFVLATALTIALTTGLVWTPTLVIGAAVSALAIGWALTLLVARPRVPTG